MSKCKDYTQVKLPNGITAIKFLYRKNKRTMWEFQCSCGNIFICSASDIVTRHTKSCGCAAYKKGKDSPNFKDLTKENLPNNIIAIKYLYSNKRGLAVWLFRCSCKKEFKAIGNNVLTKNTKSCGCLKHRKGKNSPYFRDLTKENLPNNIVAIKYLYMDNDGHSVWKFKCNCGNIFKTKGIHITSKHTKSCGCHSKQPNGGYSKKYNFSYDSAWELNFVKILEYLEIEWQREPETFDLSNEKRYIPDFYLPEFDMFIEIKGRWFKNKKGFSISKEKTKLFKKEHPQYNYYVIDEFKYKEWKEEFKFLLN